LLLFAQLGTNRELLLLVLCTLSYLMLPIALELHLTMLQCSVLSSNLQLWSQNWWQDHKPLIFAVAQLPVQSTSCWSRPNPAVALRYRLTHVQAELQAPLQPPCWTPVIRAAHMPKSHEDEPALRHSPVHHH
jgi:hypothetical protein